ncbi:MAG: T9SS type A sorting domain-containing protein [Bacteroidales bacterium]|nr:T9SS type A sorting domain-containing protein [Bacteroidales bacterium]
MTTITNNAAKFIIMVICLMMYITVAGQRINSFTPCDENKSVSQFLAETPAHAPVHTMPAQCKPVYKSTQGSFPQEIHHFYWDVTTIWMPDYNMWVTYNNQGAILTELEIDVNTGDTTGKTFYSYDNQGKQTETLYKIWSNGIWENNWRVLFVYDMYDNLEITLNQSWQNGNWFTNSGSKHIYTYDLNNNIIEEIFQVWDAGCSAWVNLDKYLYSYDFNGYMIEYITQYWDNMNSVWYSAYKQIYTNNSSGVTLEILFQNYDNGTSSWLNSLKHINIVWHNWTGNHNDSDVESYTVVHWNNGIWENYERVTVTYDAYGGSIRTNEYYSNGNWVNSTRQTFSYDPQQNYTGYLYEYWNNGVWVIDMGYKYLLTYTGNDVTRCISQIWDHVSMLWVNQWKEEYSDFMYTQGLETNSALPAEISLFPNPTHGILNLEFEYRERETPLSLQIVNLNGQAVHSQQMTASDCQAHQIDLSNCAKGLYFVKLHYNGEVKVGKVILQ